MYVSHNATYLFSGPRHVRLAERSLIYIYIYIFSNIYAHMCIRIPIDIFLILLPAAYVFRV
jgi:hypothetical protein